MVLMRRQRARGVGSEWVFHRRGKPICASVFKKQWEAARLEAKLPSKHFHDYRRSMASEQRRSGTPEGVIMKLGGWQTRSMFDRYDIRNTDDIREALARRKAYQAK